MSGEEDDGAPPEVKILLPFVDEELEVRSEMQPPMSSLAGRGTVSTEAERGGSRPAMSALCWHAAEARWAGGVDVPLLSPVVDAKLARSGLAWAAG